MNNFSIIEHALEDHAGFKGKHTIKFNPDNKPSVIFGINGSGKTSLLNALCLSFKMFGSSIGLNVDSETLGITQASIYLGKVQSFFSSSFQLNEQITSIGYKVNKILNITFFPEEIKDEFNILLNEHYAKKSEAIPILRYFRYNKLIDNTKTIVSIQQFNSIEDRSKGYENYTSPFFSIQEVTNFLITQINIENQLKIDNKDLTFQSTIVKYIRQTLDRFTTILYGEEVRVKTGASKYSNGQSLILIKEDEELEFIQLSSGEQYVFGMVLELIYRNTILNRHVANLANAPGIVLIDEIESHLHPRWQLTILDALQKSFPNVQFIVSSHSPLVASSVRKEQIIALNNFNMIPWEDLSNIYSGTANEMLRDILFSDFKINKFDTQKQEIDRLLNQLNFELAEEKLAKLKNEVQASPKWIRDYERKISFNKK